MPFVPDNRSSKAELRHAELLAALQTLTTRMETGMATLDESVTRLFTNISNEIQQVRDGLAETIANLVASGEAKDATIAELQARVDELDTLQETVATEQGRIDSKSEELEANDPTPEDPA